MPSLKCVACGKRSKYVEVEPCSVYVEGYPRPGAWGLYLGGSPLCRIHARQEATADDLKEALG